MMRLFVSSPSVGVRDHSSPISCRQTSVNRFVDINVITTSDFCSVSAHLDTCFFLTRRVRCEIILQGVICHGVFLPPLKHFTHSLLGVHKACSFKSHDCPTHAVTEGRGLTEMTLSCHRKFSRVGISAATDRSQSDTDFS